MANLGFSFDVEVAADAVYAHLNNRLFLREWLITFEPTCLILRRKIPVGDPYLDREIAAAWTFENSAHDFRITAYDGELGIDGDSDKYSENVRATLCRDECHSAAAVILRLAEFLRAAGMLWGGGQLVDELTHVCLPHDE